MMSLTLVSAVTWETIVCLGEIVHLEGARAGRAVVLGPKLQAHALAPVAVGARDRKKLY